MEIPQAPSSQEELFNPVKADGILDVLKAASHHRLVELDLCQSAIFNGKSVSVGGSPSFQTVPENQARLWGLWLSGPMSPLQSGSRR